MGRAYERIKKHHDAFKIAIACVERSPKSREGWFLVGISGLNAGEVDEVLKSFERLGMHFPEDDEVFRVHYMCAVKLHFQKREKEAIHSMEIFLNHVLKAMESNGERLNGVTQWVCELNDMYVAGISDIDRRNRLASLREMALLIAESSNSDNKVWAKQAALEISNASLSAQNSKIDSKSLLEWVTQIEAVDSEYIRSQCFERCTRALRTLGSEIDDPKYLRSHVQEMLDTELRYKVPHRAKCKCLGAIIAMLENRSTE